METVDSDELQLQDEFDSLWVNLWRAEAEGKLIHLKK